MKIIIKNIIYLGLISEFILVAIDPAMAATGLNKMTDAFTTQLPAVVDVLGIISYISGVGFGIKSALKLKESNENKGQTPLSQPITLAVVAGTLLALPTMLTVAVESVFGTVQAGGKTEMTGTGMRTIK